MPILPNEIVDEMNLDTAQRQLLQDRENNVIFRWYVRERYSLYLAAPLDLTLKAMKKGLMTNLGLDDFDRLTDFEIDDKVARTLGGVCYPSDSVEEGNYWHFDRDFLEEAFWYGDRVHRSVFRPTVLGSFMFCYALKNIDTLKVSDVNRKLYSARGGVNKPWHTDTLPRAVALAFLDTLS